jgi:acid phosphatase family membrane protein YuiD
MRKDLVENAAYEVATQVRAVEEVIENALEEIAELQMRMIRARAATRVATATGHDALTHLAGALNGLVAARGGMASCHAALVEVKQFIPGLRTVGFGDASECPPGPKGAVDLRVVI